MVCEISVILGLYLSSRDVYGLLGEQLNIGLAPRPFFIDASKSPSPMFEMINVLWYYTITLVSSAFDNRACSIPRILEHIRTLYDQPSAGWRALVTEYSPRKVTRTHASSRFRSSRPLSCHTILKTSRSIQLLYILHLSVGMQQCGINLQVCWQGPSVSLMPKLLSMAMSFPPHSI